MTKFRKSSQPEKATALKSTRKFIVKKQRRRRDNKESSNGIHKNDLKKLNASNDITENIITNTQKRSSRNKFAAEDIERPNVLKKYARNNKKISEIFQKVQINIDGKTKRKKRNKRQKQDVNLDPANKHVARADDSAKERNKKLQMPAKKSIDLEHKEPKVQKFKKVNEKRMKQISAKPEVQKIKPDKILKLSKHKIKIKQLEEMLTSKSHTKQITQPLTLRDRMMAQLRASRFRFINETLYNNDSSQSKHYFNEDPDAFKAYHAGYKQQLEQWPVNPLDIIISSIKKLPKDNVIADFGCGEARLAASVPHTVHSFDFIALDDRVKACDMAHTPLLMNSVHIVVFCLSLMGSNLNDYIMEANRVLKNDGILKIAEVKSRFEDVKDFIRLLHSYGFKNIWKDLSHDLFYFMDFKKEEDVSMKRKNLPPITLKSCLYKKR